MMFCKNKAFRSFTLLFVLAVHCIANASDPASKQDYFTNFISAINTYWGGVVFWSDHPLKLPLILLVMVFGGVFFTLRYRFVNIRLFKHAIDVVRGKFDDPKHAGEITHFQALSAALSATVGLGNIAGVAIAISLGGPGAVFWLWVIAFFGMNMKFSSCTFSQLHRVIKKDGSILGGPMVYLDKGFKTFLPRFSLFGKGLAVSYAAFTIVASLGGGNMFQGNQIFELVGDQFPSLAEYSWLIGIVLAFLVGVVIIGGVSRVGQVASKMVPLMCVFYCCGCLVIIIGNYTQVPELFFQILKQAFSPDAMWAGGFVGVLTQGVKRASFSNEAGIGSAAIVHAAAKTDKPVREGVVAMLGPFIDTHIVCTMSALTILITKSHLVEGLSGKGAAITSHAFASIGTYMPVFLTVAVCVFAYSTMISWCYYGEKGFEYLFGRKYIFIYRYLYVACVALGPTMSLSAVIEFSDLMLLSMAFPNIIGMLFLSGQVKVLLEKYLHEHDSFCYEKKTVKIRG
jgi:alanine or glycine:cation symporter, AGCS family